MTWATNTNNSTQVLYYIVHTNSTSPNGSGAANVTNTALVLHGLVPGVYTTTVVAVNCAGHSNVSVVGPYELVGYGE